MKPASRLIAPLVALAALSAATSANATLVTFDNLTTTYGVGKPLGANMTLNGKALSYTEAGFVFTLYAPNALTPNDVHIGDAGQRSSFNWHDGGENGADSYVVLTAADGGTFDLGNFSYGTTKTLTVSAEGYDRLELTGSGVLSPRFLNVSSVVFTSSNYTYNLLDGFTVAYTARDPHTLPEPTPIPEPASLALVGLGLAGFAAVRRGVKKR